MTNRIMRVIIFFDLPAISSADKIEYRKFKKFLVKNGFLMMQESVYSKLATTQTSADLIISLIKMNKPTSGIVEILTLTEKQYQNIEYVVGKRQNKIIDTDERIVII